MSKWLGYLYKLSFELLVRFDEFIPVYGIIGLFQHKGQSVHIIAILFHNKKMDSTFLIDR